MENKFEVDFYEEAHCDYCQETIHFHIDECPVCKTKDAETDQ